MGCEYEVLLRRDDLIWCLKEERCMIAREDQGDLGEISRRPNLVWPMDH